MRGYIDLHCHWVAGIDDGARTTADSVAMLRALHQVGFDTVMATPHMRTGMFDNSREELEQAFAHSLKQVSEHPDLPSVALSSEHHLDDLVFAALMDDRGLPYPPGHAALVEFPNQHFPLKHEHRLYELIPEQEIARIDAEAAAARARRPACARTQDYTPEHSKWSTQYHVASNG